MNQQEFLDASERAFIAFAAQHPDFPADLERYEAYAHVMAITLRKMKLSPTNPEHLAQAWERMKQTGTRPVAASASASPSPAASAPSPSRSTTEQDVDSKARALIVKGLTLQQIDAMPTSQLEMFVNSAIGQRVYEILSPPKPVEHRTLGDFQHEAAERERAHRARLESEANARTNAIAAEARRNAGRTGTQNNPNLLQAMPLPKTSSERIALQREKSRIEDQQFVQQSTAKAARRQRVMANR